MERRGQTAALPPKTEERMRAMSTSSTSSSGGSEDQSCAICFQSQKNWQDAVQTECGHAFCSECVEEALDFGMRNCPLCRGRMSMYNVVNMRTKKALRLPEITTIWGATFIQNNELGLASYHFAEDGSAAWISYDPEVIPSCWLLRNGKPPPARKYFVDFGYDVAKRTFRGIIDWSPTTFDGHVKWVYTMVLDESMNFIEDGGIKAYDANGKMCEEMYFLEHLFYRRVRKTIYDSVFVQTTVFSMLLSNHRSMVGKASYHFDTSGSWISYSSASDTWRLDSGERLPQRKYFKNASYDAETRTFTGYVDWSTTPIGNAIRWDFEMHFDLELSKIEDGFVQTVFADGTSEKKRFGRDLSYIVLDVRL